MSKELSVVSNKEFNFSFDPVECATCGGKCCLGESGYVWISKEEIETLAILLDLTVEDVKDHYLLAVGNSYTIEETELSIDNFACIFFDLEKRCCSIYSARPSQCRTFPFWDDYLFFKDASFYECPGIILE